jgi:hypothetical protein
VNDPPTDLGPRDRHTVAAILQSEHRGATAAILPFAARAQQGERMRRIGVLTGAAADDPDALARQAAFVQGLQQLGWTDGRNVRIDTRWAAGNAADLRKYAAELATA